VCELIRMTSALLKEWRKSGFCAEMIEICVAWLAGWCLVSVLVLRSA
jgi:hypothetical protein